jgi:hypothetical protein
MEKKAKELGIGIRQSLDLTELPQNETIAATKEQLEQLVYSSHPSGDLFADEVQEIVGRLKESLKRYL